MHGFKNTLANRRARPTAHFERLPLGAPGGQGRPSHLLLLRLPLLIPLGLAAGAAYYLEAVTEPSWRTLCLALIGSGALYALAASFRRSILASVFLSVCMAPTGAIIAKVRAHCIAAPTLESQLGPVRIEGRLVEIDANDTNQRLRLEVQAISNLPIDQTPRYVRFSYRFDDGGFTPGRYLACPAILLPPPRPLLAGDYAFDRDAWFEQLGAVGYAVGRCETVYGATSPTTAEDLRLRVAAVRRTIAKHIVGLGSGPGAPFAAAVVTGDRTFIEPEDVDALRGSGLAHLLAISGLHMALAGGVIFAGLRLVWPLTGPLALKLPAVKVAAAGAIVGCTMYYLLSGDSVATQRAYIMAVIGLTAKLMDKPALSIRSLAVAFGTLVALRPEAVVTPGFQMSFAASAALIGAFECWPTKQRRERTSLPTRAGGWISGALLTSVAASLATAPFAIHHFDRAATASVLANLAATPVVSFWAAPAGAAALLAAPIGAQDPFLTLLSKALELILKIAHWTSDASPMFAPNPVSAWALVGFALAITLFALTPGKWRWWSLLPLLIALAAWTTAVKPDGYLTSDGRLYLRSSEGWGEIDLAGRSNGLTPLKLADLSPKKLCSRTDGYECEVQTAATTVLTRYRPAQTSQEADAARGHPASAFIELIDARSRSPIAISTTSRGDRSYEIYLSDTGVRVEPKQLPTDRPWSRSNAVRRPQ